jgi:hypothetical protein
MSTTEETNEIMNEFKNKIINKLKIEIDKNIQKKKIIINELKIKINEEKNIQKKNKINKLIEISSNYINDKEAIALIIYINNNIGFNIDNLLELVYGNKCLKHNQKKSVLKESLIKGNNYLYLFDESEKNTLLALQILNKYSIDHKIRVEDAKILFEEYIKSL